MTETEMEKTVGGKEEGEEEKDSEVRGCVFVFEIERNREGNTCYCIISAGL